MKGFLKILKNIGASAKGFFFSIFGIDRFAKSEEGQALQDSFNSVAKNFTGKPVFQTQKVKAEIEKKAKEKERENLQSLADNTKRQNELLEELLDEFKRRS